MWENATDEVIDAAILVLSEELREMVREKRGKRGRKCRNQIACRKSLGHQTLRFLANGDSFSTLALLFRIPPCTISRFLPETLQSTDFQENIAPLQPCKFRLINIVSSSSNFFFYLRKLLPVHFLSSFTEPPHF
jgi:hypothetical protein